jgi:hypothetical protein
MVNYIFKKTILISLLGHITVFSIFNFSFGNSIPNAQYASVAFWGQIPIGSILPRGKNIFPTRLDTSMLDKPRVRGSSILSGYYFKPLFAPEFNTEKETFINKSSNRLFFSRISKPSIIFHPTLPYSFTLYFKDRQVAHVELAYKVILQGGRNSVLLNRKISSGNLEVDLLTMRYIGRYLFMQQANMPTDNWQIVQIDLSPKND